MYSQSIFMTHCHTFGRVWMQIANPFLFSIIVTEHHISCNMTLFVGKCEIWWITKITYYYIWRVWVLFNFHPFPPLEFIDCNINIMAIYSVMEQNKQFNDLSVKSTFVCSMIHIVTLPPTFITCCRLPYYLILHVFERSNSTTTILCCNFLWTLTWLTWIILHLFIACHNGNYFSF